MLKKIITSILKNSSENKNLDNASDSLVLENINEFFAEYPIKDVQCKHNILIDYEKIFKIYDGKFGYLSYLQFKSSNDSEIFLGSYPMNGADLWKCKKCGKLKFFYTETGGHFPQTLSLDVDFNKKYLSDPFAKSVSIKAEKLSDFITTFGFAELQNPEKIEKFNGIKVIDKSKSYIFGYHEFNRNITFNMIADKNTLRKVYDFENS
ncbi:hypothetical protein [Chryseobacterium mucoviscidosis]|uniref:hypothetical protein n=1 Tax=Chryseobacterium mucoviscidosis TaxID=1945581 RepID=UPI0030171004